MTATTRPQSQGKPDIANKSKQNEKTGSAASEQRGSVMPLNKYIAHAGEALSRQALDAQNVDGARGLIAVDALYSPVKRVAYRVEPVSILDITQGRAKTDAQGLVVYRKLDDEGK